MKHSRILVASWISFATVAVLIVWFSVSSVPVAAQSAGQNGVYDSLGVNVVNSSNLVDTSVCANKVSNHNFSFS
jgi:hypothetical protein